MSILASMHITYIRDFSNSFNYLLIILSLLASLLYICTSAGSNGVATFNNVPAGEVIIKVTAQAPYEESVISSSITVPKMNSECSIYLINDMITTVGDTVIIQFGSTGQPRGFLCTSDGYKKSCRFLCLLIKATMSSDSLR